MKTLTGFTALISIALLAGCPDGSSSPDIDKLAEKAKEGLEVGVKEAKKGYKVAKKGAEKGYEVAQKEVEKIVEGKPAGEEAPKVTGGMGKRVPKGHSAAFSLGDKFHTFSYSQITVYGVKKDEPKVQISAVPTGKKVFGAKETKLFFDWTVALYRESIRFSV